MEQQILLERVRVARENAQNGVLGIRSVTALLADLEQYLAAEKPATTTAPDPTEIANRAITFLSYSEHEALAAIMEELPPEGGLVVASQVADRTGVTRSVIVNGLRKLESAGVIASRSLGMKGTRIEFIIPEIRDALIKKPAA